MPFITIASGLTIKAPTKNTRNYDETMRTDTWIKISEHDHSGSGKGLQIPAAGLGADSVTGVKIRLENDEYLRARNAANTGDINILKINASDEVEFGSTVGSVELQDDGLTIVDNGDNTKVLAFDVGSVSTGVTRTLTVPDASGGIVVDTATQTLSNKTLSGNTAANLISGSGTLVLNTAGTMTVPSGTDTLLGRTESATVTDKSIDSDNNTITNIANADIKAAAAIANNKLEVNTASRALASDGSGFITPSATTSTELGYVSGVTSAIQTQLGTKTDTGTASEITLTGTTIGLADNPVLPGTGSTTLPAGTTAQRSGSPANGMFRFNTDTSGFEGYDGSAWGEIGGGSAGINYILDGSDAEAGIGSWNTYADAAGTKPVDGTGGSPTITFAQNSTTPLRGSADFKLVKDAANRQGEGASYDFTVDKADLASVLRIEFDYDASDSDYADGDIIVYIYDKDGTQLNEPVGIDLKAGKGTHVAYFQTDSANDDYRLILHQSSTNAAAYDIYMDRFEVKPATRTYSTPTTDWKDVSSLATLSNIAGSFSYLEARRVGDTVHVMGKIVASGTATGNVGVDLSSTYPAATNWTNQTAGSARFGGSTINASLNCRLQSGVIVFQYEGSIVNASTPSGDGGMDSGEEIVFETFWKVAGWGSQVQMSDEADTREVTLTANGNAGEAFTTGNIPFIASTDSHSSWDGSLFTAPVTGLYSFSGMVFCTTSAARRIDIYKNGSRVLIADTGLTTTLHKFDGKVQLVKGDQLSVRSNGSGTLQNDSAFHWLVINKEAAPTAIAANESVVAHYETNAGATMTNNTSTLIDFEDKVIDTHNAMSGGTFTAPVSGNYSVSATTLLAAAAGWVTGELSQLQLYKNGSKDSDLHIHVTQGNHSTLTSNSGSMVVSLEKGDTISVRLNQNSGGNIALNANGDNNHISIHRLGF